MTPTYVLVHGAFCNATQWGQVQRELGLLGQRTVAVELPGHGFGSTRSEAYQAPQDPEALATAPSAIAGVTLADNVAHLIDVLRRAKQHGPVVLVAHSRGGLTVTAAANVVPELIDRLVYISAWLPVDRAVVEYLGEPEFESQQGGFADTLVGNPAALGAIRQNFRTASPDHLEEFQRQFLHDGSREQLLTFLNAFDLDENLDVGGADDRARADTWGTIPRSYIRQLDDRAFVPAAQDRLIAEADALTPDNPFEVHSLPGSHLGPFVEGRDLARLLSDHCRPGSSS